MEEQWSIPAGTRTIKFIIMGERISGIDNDSYLDELFLHLNLASDSCSQYVPPLVSVKKPDGNRTPKIYPNPVSGQAIVNIPGTAHNQLMIRLYDSGGKLVKEYPNVAPPTFYFEKEDLPNGPYVMQIIGNNEVLHNIKFGLVD